MDNETLKQMRSSLARLTIVNKRLAKLRNEIAETEMKVKSLEEKYEKEYIDVEQLKKDSLSVTLLKFAGKYDNKVTKETEEMLAAKMEYDKASARLNELYIERDELGRNKSELNRNKHLYEEELKRRKNKIRNSMNNEASTIYRRYEDEQEVLARQLVETEEALRASRRVKITSASAMKHLDSAENWATFDVWTRGGILTHMAKYNHVDNAQTDFNRLNSRLRDLHKELADVNMHPGFTGIDGTTRAVDFWLDNIFTDLHVRNRIRDDKERLRVLRGKINNIINKLTDNKNEINKKLDEIEHKKNNLIINSVDL